MKIATRCFQRLKWTGGGVTLSSMKKHQGTLTVEVRIKPDDEHCCLNFIPKNASAQNILRSFMDENTADVVFEKGESEGGKQDESPKNVLFQFCAEGSILASLCEDYDKSTPVLIVDISPQVFRQIQMLFYVYGGNIAASVWKDHSKNLIDAADKYGLKNFKIEAEAWYVKPIKITVDIM